MTRIITLSLPFSILWMILTGEENIAGFVLGFFVSAAILSLVHGERTNLSAKRLPFQIIALVAYIARLAIDIFLSSIDVARRVLDPRLPIEPGIISVPTQDPTHDPIISALSAHAITITPGELVVDFEKENDETVMFVHTLDKNSSRDQLAIQQTRRLNLIRRILGHD